MSDGDDSGTTCCPKVLRTVKQLLTTHTYLNKGGLRWALFHRETNGLNKYVMNMGRRLLIDEEGFLEWLKERGNLPLHVPTLGIDDNHVGRN